MSVGRSHNSAVSEEKFDGVKRNGKTRLVIKLCTEMAVSPLIQTFIGSGRADIKYLRGADVYTNVNRRCILRF
jgi:hypothetical protein